MNLSSARIALRPRSVAEIVDLSCLLVAREIPGPLLRLGLVVLLPPYLVCLAAHHLLHWHWFWVWTLAFLLSTLAQGAYTVAVGRWMFAAEIPVVDVLAALRGRLRAYLMAFVSTRLLLGLASLAMPLLAFRYFFLYEAALLEGASAGDASRRSTRLVADDVGRAFVVWLTCLAVQVGCVVIAEVVGQGLVADLLMLGEPLGSTLGQGVSAYGLAGLMLSAPLVATIRFVEYVDRRTRGDGWDIQVRFMAIAHALGAKGMSA